MQNDDNCRQSRTIVDKYLKPPFAKPPFRLSRVYFLRKSGFTKFWVLGNSGGLNDFFEGVKTSRARFSACLHDFSRGRLR